MPFELKREHVLLLQNAYVSWNDCETGAPTIDPKRPYGNSYVEGDVAKILGIEGEGEDGELTWAQEEVCREWHGETLDALQEIVHRAGELLPDDDDMPE